MAMKLESSRVMTVKELSEYLKVHPSTVYRQLKRGGLPAFKVGSDGASIIESTPIAGACRQDNLSKAEFDKKGRQDRFRHGRRGKGPSPKKTSSKKPSPTRRAGPLAARPFFRTSLKSAEPRAGKDARCVGTGAVRRKPEPRLFPSSS